VIGPALYLMVMSITRGRVSKPHYFHLLFPIIYFILVIPFFLLPEDVKYNAWVNSYKLDLPMRDYDYNNRDPRIFWITDNHTQLTLLSFILYAVLSLSEVVRIYREKKESFFRSVHPVLVKLRSGVLTMAIATILLVVIKIFNTNDTGDHMPAAYISIVIYALSFKAMRQSGFFRQVNLDEPQKYKTSGVTAEQQQLLLNRLKNFMISEKPFLKADFSLPELAQKLGTSVHILSQVINSGLNKSFFEMTSSYRIEEAKHLLVTQSNVKMEEIAEQVGYNSKSSFNTAFKKITGSTPSEFRQTKSR
jgi:AraC-like DNA-binding protein